MGTRPEVIRLSRTIDLLDRVSEHKTLHTGQNFDHNLHDLFFDQLDLRRPDCQLQATGSLAQQMTTIFTGVEKFINDFVPDAVLLLGDTTSALSAIVCERMGVPVFHMEAGNRCYDLSVPEEKNRRVVDAISTVNMPYTLLSRENLLREGQHNSKIVTIGNPIKEVIDWYWHSIDASTVLSRLNLDRFGYVVASCHRAENVDNPDRLQAVVRALNQISLDRPVVFSCHPRTQQRLQKLSVKLNNTVIVSEPLGFFDWVKLEVNAYAAITDSGTVQEEMCIFGRPTITIRNSTERPETVWCGSNQVVGLDTENIVKCYENLCTWDLGWDLPEGYQATNVSQRVVNVLMAKL